MCDIDGVLYSKDKTTLLFYPTGKGTGYDVPAGTVTIADHAFNSNGKIETLTLPDGLERIEDDAIQSCTALRSIYFPSTLTRLDYGVIRNCHALEEIHTCVRSPSTIGMGSNVFEDIDKDKCILYVPIGTKALYEAADQWKDFANIVEEETTNIGEIHNNRVRVVAKDNVIEVKNAPAWSLIKIYAVTGQLVYSGYDTTVPIYETGTYITIVRGRTWKVFVRTK